MHKPEQDDVTGRRFRGYRGTASFDALIVGRVAESGATLLSRPAVVVVVRIIVVIVKDGPLPLGLVPQHGWPRGPNANSRPCSWRSEDA